MERVLRSMAQSANRSERSSNSSTAREPPAGRTAPPTPHPEVAFSVKHLGIAFDATRRNEAMRARAFGPFAAARLPQSFSALDQLAAFNGRDLHESRRRSGSRTCSFHRRTAATVCPGSKWVCVHAICRVSPTAREESTADRCRPRLLSAKCRAPTPHAPATPVPADSAVT